MRPTMEAWHRRQAIVLASQLPDNIEDARPVLEALREVVEGFLAPKATLEQRPSATVVRIRGNESAGSGAW
jgi:hypothetical protein